MKATRLHRISNAEIVHYYSKEDIITSKHNVINAKIDGAVHKIVLSISPLQRILGLFRIARRALRLDKCNVFKAANNLVIIKQSKVYCYNLASRELKHTLTLKNCRNVLHQSMGIASNGMLFFGEYGNNGERKAVNVYRSKDDGASWEVIYQFPAGEIKHIHGCYYDVYENKVWTLTGDFKKENIIMKSDLDFSTNEKIGDGSQKYRAVNVFFTENKVHWIMDSPLEKSYHYVLDRATKAIERKSLFPGPVWYLKKLTDDHYLAASSVEIGEGVLEKKASLFVSKDLENWECVAKFDKDMLPMRYFKWGVIAFADGEQDSNAVPLHFEALKRVDGKSYMYAINEG
ncbi:hypothetical protein ACFQ1M_12985 [Sungkyunkwania multivorans]|uniref:Glycosyl hydrolase n=1 Tax=Sungkyunkwania multivorans TaxID=1173618 RepID=A0ABW3CZK6_9FLAO